mmetsp:Transcript_5173/g.15417  ORF Transcript_5173/g.15417 Transcript_5173/m.15417 type:complete len:942 (-) Transcript_5173:3694-6519(-)
MNLAQQRRVVQQRRLGRKPAVQAVEQLAVGVEVRPQVLELGRQVRILATCLRHGLQEELVVVRGQVQPYPRLAQRPLGVLALGRPALPEGQDLLPFVLAHRGDLLHHGDEGLEAAHRHLRRVIQCLQEITHPSVFLDHFFRQLAPLHVADAPRVLQGADAQPGLQIDLQADASVHARAVDLASPAASCQILTLQYPIHVGEAILLRVGHRHGALAEVGLRRGAGPPELRVLLQLPGAQRVQRGRHQGGQDLGGVAHGHAGGLAEREPLAPPAEELRHLGREAAADPARPIERREVGVALREGRPAHRHIAKGSQVPHGALVDPEARRRAPELSVAELRAQHADAPAVAAPDVLEALVDPLHDCVQRLAGDKRHLRADEEGGRATHLRELLGQGVLQLGALGVAVLRVQAPEADPRLGERRGEDAAEGPRRPRAVEAEVEIHVPRGQHAAQVVLVRQRQDVVGAETQISAAARILRPLRLLEPHLGAQPRHDVERQGLRCLVHGVDPGPGGLAIAQSTLAALPLEVSLVEGELDQARVLEVAGRVAHDPGRGAALPVQLAEDHHLAVAARPSHAAEADVGRQRLDDARPGAPRGGRLGPDAKAFVKIPRQDLGPCALWGELRLQRQDHAARREDLASVHVQRLACGDPNREEALFACQLHRVLPEQTLLAGFQRDADEAADKASDGAALGLHGGSLLVTAVLNVEVLLLHKHGIAGTQRRPAADVHRRLDGDYVPRAPEGFRRDGSPHAALVEQRRAPARELRRGGLLRPTHALRFEPSPWPEAKVHSGELSRTAHSQVLHVPEFPLRCVRCVLLRAAGRLAGAGLPQPQPQAPLLEAVVLLGDALAQPLRNRNPWTRVRDGLVGGGDANQFLEHCAEAILVICPIDDGAHVKVSQTGVLQPLLEPALFDLMFCPEHFNRHGPLGHAGIVRLVRNEHVAADA